MRSVASMIDKYVYYQGKFTQDKYDFLISPCFNKTSIAFQQQLTEINNGKIIVINSEPNPIHLNVKILSKNVLYPNIFAILLAMSSPSPESPEMMANVVFNYLKDLVNKSNPSRVLLISDMFVELIWIDKIFMGNTLHNDNGFNRTQAEIIISLLSKKDYKSIEAYIVLLYAEANQIPSIKRDYHPINASWYFNGIRKLNARRTPTNIVLTDWVMDSCDHRSDDTMLIAGTFFLKKYLKSLHSSQEWYNKSINGQIEWLKR